MVLHVCRDCDREFTKTEHFKRHQRSHTKERPYECQTCGKAFSRSDVLFRHTKLHNEPVTDGQIPSPSHSTPQTGGAESSPHDSSQQSRSLIPTKRPAELDTQSLQSASQQQYAHIDPSLRAMRPPNLTNIPNMNGSSDMNATTDIAGNVGLNGSLDHFRSPLSSTSPISTQRAGHSMMQAPLQTRNYAPPMMTTNIPARNNMDGPQDMTTIMQPGAQNGALSNDIQRDPMQSGGVLDSGFDIGNFDGNASDMLQYWLSQADNDIDFNMISMPAFGGPLHHGNASSAPYSSPPPVQRSDSGSINSIPEARFARVEEVWHAKVAKSHCFQNLWLELAQSPFVNIFCCDKDLMHTPNHGTHPDTRWGIGPAVRAQLRMEFGTPTTTPDRARNNSSKQATRLPNFPPAEVLDISLGIYFRRMHPMSPFIHVPTFQASATPPGLLFVMCVLGLSTMNTSGGSKFLKKAFLDIRHRAITEMVATASSATTLEERMIAYATSFLALQLAVFSSDVDLIAQSQALYSMLLAIATRQGLFNAPGASSVEFLNPTLSIKERWQAWARVESIRRLISCLITTDWWWGNNACVCPIVHPEVIQMSLPGDDDLFAARTAEDWWQLIQSGRNMDMPTILPRGFHLKGALDPVLIQPHPIQAFSMFSVLSLIKHMISDVQHRYFAQIDDWNGLDRLVPWKAFRLDFRACSFVPSVVQLAHPSIASRRQGNLNVAVLWHNVNLNLTANMQIFELAAGRSGAVRGAKALADIAEWSKTPAGRRAAIHAAQTYKMLSNRKVSDTMMLNCMSALFSAALVLGLYVFQMPTPDNVAVGAGPASRPFELMDDIDWTMVGDCGLTDPVTNPVTMYDAHQRTAVSDFINFGGPVVINGLQSAGYVSARRILLDFAHLMDEMGAFKPRMFSRILHIMSDVLEDTP